VFGRGFFYGFEHIRIVEYLKVYNCGLAHVLEVLIFIIRFNNIRNTNAANIFKYIILIYINSMLSYRV